MSGMTGILIRAREQEIIHQLCGRVADFAPQWLHLYHQQNETKKLLIKTFIIFSFFVRFSNICSSKLCPFWPSRPRPPQSVSLIESTCNEFSQLSRTQPFALLYDQNNHVSWTTTWKNTTIKTKNKQTPDKEARRKGGSRTIRVNWLTKTKDARASATQKWSVDKPKKNFKSKLETFKWKHLKEKKLSEESCIYKIAAVIFFNFVRRQNLTVTSWVLRFTV